MLHLRLRWLTGPRPQATSLLEPPTDLCWHEKIINHRYHKYIINHECKIYIIKIFIYQKYFILSSGDENKWLWRSRVVSFAINPWKFKDCCRAENTFRHDEILRFVVGWAAWGGFHGCRCCPSRSSLLMSRSDRAANADGQREDEWSDEYHVVNWRQRVFHFHRHIAFVLPRIPFIGFLFFFFLFFFFSFCRRIWLHNIYECWELSTLKMHAYCISNKIRVLLI